MLRAFLLVLRSYLEFKDRPGYVLKGPPGKRRWHKWWGGGYEGDQEAHLREGLHGESIGRVADLMSSLTFKDFGTPRLVHMSRVPLFAVDTPIGQAIVKPLNDPAFQNRASDYGLSLQEFQDMVAAGATLAYRAADALGVPIVPVGIISPAASEGHSEWVEGVLDALRGGGTASEFLEAIPPDHRAEFERRVKEYSSYWTQPFAERVLRQTSWVVSPFVESVGLRPKSVVKGGGA